MLCNTTIIRYLNKPTQSKTQLTQEVVNSFNTYYTHTDGLMMKIASNANWCEAVMILITLQVSLQIIGCFDHDL
jgi:hypothetical protein